MHSPALARLPQHILFIWSNNVGNLIDTQQTPIFGYLKCVNWLLTFFGSASFDFIGSFQDLSYSNNMPRLTSLDPDIPIDTDGHFKGKV